MTQMERGTSQGSEDQKVVVIQARSEGHLKTKESMDGGFDAAGPHLPVCRTMRSEGAEISRSGRLLADRLIVSLIEAKAILCVLVVAIDVVDLPGVEESKWRFSLDRVPRIAEASIERVVVILVDRTLTVAIHEIGGIHGETAV